MIAEFTTPGIGSEFRLRTLLMDCLVDLIRWEESVGRQVEPSASSVDWLPIGKTIRYIHEHYAEPLYISELARAVGVSAGRLPIDFSGGPGMSWLQYCAAGGSRRRSPRSAPPNARVTEVALAVGFETLSHFNTSFRDFTGMAPNGIHSNDAGAKTAFDF